MKNSLNTQITFYLIWFMVCVVLILIIIELISMLKKLLYAINYILINNLFFWIFISNDMKWIFLSKWKLIKTNIAEVKNEIPLILSRILKIMLKFT